MTYQTRFIKKEQVTELINLWHLSKVPTTDLTIGRRHARMIWTSKEFASKYDMNRTAVYKDLENLIGNY